MYRGMRRNIPGSFGIPNSTSSSCPERGQDEQAYQIGRWIEGGGDMSVIAPQAYALVDRELMPLLDQIPAVTLSIDALPAIRADMARVLGATRSDDIAVTTEIVEIDGKARGDRVRLLIYR